jgi:hypothetical protein
LFLWQQDRPSVRPGRGLPRRRQCSGSLKNLVAISRSRIALSHYIPTTLGPTIKKSPAKAGPSCHVESPSIQGKPGTNGPASQPTNASSVPKEKARSGSCQAKVPGHSKPWTRTAAVDQRRETKKTTTRVHHSNALAVPAARLKVVPTSTRGIGGRSRDPLFPYGAS